MIVVNKEDCIRCGACQGICPTAAIAVSPEDVIYCDMCADEPKCVQVCPKSALKTGEIVVGEDGKTETRIVYNPSLCDECGECVEICPPQIMKLDKGEMKKIPLEGYCVMCQRCVDICPVDVIGIEGVREPAKSEKEITGPIYISDCVGCGLCVEECPVEAITLSQPGGTIEIDEEKCIYCGICAQTCPWNAVYISSKKPQKRSREVTKFEVDEDTCIGCNICVEACPGDFIAEKPSKLTVDLPEVCTYCGLCAKLCPVDAIECDVKLGLAKPASDVGLVFDAEKCENIGACARICPTEAIRVITSEGKLVPGEIETTEEPYLAMCTRCGACTTVCPEGALTLVDVNKVINGEVVTRKRVQFNPSLCNECGDCVEVCPYEMLKLKPGEKVPLKGFCILCDDVFHYFNPIHTVNS